MTKERKRGRGRPPKYAIEPIPATFEEVLEAVLRPVQASPFPVEQLEDDEDNGDAEVRGDLSP